MTPFPYAYSLGVSPSPTRGVTAWRKDSGPDMQLERVAEEIRGIERKTELAKTLAVGRVIAERLFEGSLDAWRERKKFRNNAVERLVRTGNCPLSRTAIVNALGVYAVASTVPRVLSLQNIESAHISAVLALAPVEQERWLTEADARRWTVQQLRDAVRDERRRAGERRGRPRSTAERRALSATRSSLELIEASIGALTSAQLAALEPAAVEELNTRIAAVRSQLGAVSEARSVEEESG
jgi:hypothetical protein